MARSRQNCICIFTLLATLALGGAGAEGTRQAVAQSQGQEHHAGIVLQFADGSVQKYCLAFAGDSISGLDLLLKTGLEVKLEAYGGMGGLVCKIGHDGCDYPGQPCVCQSYGPGGVYWTYHHLKDGQWRSSVVGAGSYKVHDGDLEGWAWSGGKPPPMFTFRQICGASLPEQANTRPPATATPTQAHIRATVTPRPQLTQIKPLTPRNTTTTHTQPGVTNTSSPSVTHTIVMSTATPILTAQPYPTPLSTWTLLATSTIQATTPGPGRTNVAGGDTSEVRIIAIVAGFGAAFAFVLWRGLSTARSRNKGDHVD